MATVQEKLNYLLETKNQIKNAIENQGVEVSDKDTFRNYAEKIANIKPIYEELVITPSIEEQIKEGSFNKVTVEAISTEELNVTSSLENQTYEGIYGKVNIEGIDTEEITIIPSSEEQVREGIFNKVTVNAIETEELSVIPSKDEQEYNGMFDKVTVKSAVDGEPNLLPENIKEGTSIFGVEGVAKTTNAKITSGYYLFAENNRIDYVNELLPLCENVTITKRMFYKSDKIEKLDLSNLDTSNVTDMAEMFYMCDDLSELDISNLNTSKVTNMYQMFFGCTMLKPDISSFDTSNVTNMGSMFSGIKFLNSLDLSNFNTSNVTDMSYMFYIQDSWLRTLNVSSFDTSNVTDMSSMFASNKVLTDLNISNFDFRKTNNINSIFYGLKQLTNLSFGHNLGKGFTRETVNYNSYNLKLSDSTELTHESLMDVINNLYDLNLTYDVANGGTLYTQQLILGSTNLAKLTPEEINVAVEKGWTVS